MSFSKENKNIGNMLRATEGSKTRTEARTTEEVERTKQFQFTLQPSVREKIAKIAKEQGYRSASSFLNDYFKKL